MTAPQPVGGGRSESAAAARPGRDPLSRVLEAVARTACLLSGASAASVELVSHRGLEDRPPTPFVSRTADAERVVVPLRADGHVVAILRVGPTPGGMDDEGLLQLVRFAPAAAATIVQAGQTG